MENAVTVTLATDDSYTLGSETITINADSTTGTVQLTAVNNRVDAASKEVNLATGATASDPRVGFTSADPTLTINDDDELDAPGNLRTANHTASTFEVQWDRVAGDVSYKLQYKLTTSDTWISAPGIPAGTGCRVGNDTTKCSYTVSSAAGSSYDVRVAASKAPAGQVTDTAVDDSPYATLVAGAGLDYDTDNDGYIEVSNLAQLNAIRWDTNANGAADSASNNNDYKGATGAFPNGAPDMGCPSPGCVGYELRANLDFNTNNSATSSTNPTGANEGDAYWNTGSGWDPIGGTAGDQKYTGGFDGNMDSDSDGDGGPYTIRNLYQNWTSGNYVGLFAHLDRTNDDVWHVALENVDITFDNSGNGTNQDVHVGALAGRSDKNILRSYTTGRIEADVNLTQANKYLYAGGLVGRLMNAKVESSYSWVDVDADIQDSTAVARVYAGGLVGLTGEVPLTSFPSNDVVASWAAGDVTAQAKVNLPNQGEVYAGGLVGAAYRGSEIMASYARGDVKGTANSGKIYRGALVGYITGTGTNQAPSRINASYATGKLSGTTLSDATKCGLIGDRTTGTVLNSYYNSDTLGATGCDSGHGTGTTTVVLQKHIAYGTGPNAIYIDWNLDFDNDTNRDDPWDFGTSSQYPVSKYAANTRKLTVTDQRPTVTLAVSETTLYEKVGGATSATLTATLSAPWNEDLTVTLPAAADGLAVGGSNQVSGILTFSTTTWQTAQTATVKLAAAPSKTIVVDFDRLSANDPEVTPRYLTFTTSDWNTAQNISVKFLAEPSAETTRVAIDGTGNDKVYKVDLNVYRRAYDLSALKVAIPAGDVTGVVTLTAQNDYNDLPDATSTLALLTHPTMTKWVSTGTTDLQITITDDDELGQVTGVAVAQKTDAGGNLIGGATVSWTKVTGATGYVVEWKSGSQLYDTSRQVAAGNVASIEISAASLSPGTTYDVRVYATKSGSDHGLPSDEVSATYKGQLVFDKTALTIDEATSTNVATSSYTVKLSVQPGTTTTVSIGYRVPELIVTPASVTFNSSNWNQWQTFTVETDEFPPRGTAATTGRPPPSPTRAPWTSVFRPGLSSTTGR